MFGKVTQQRVHHAWQGLKGHLRNSFDTGRHFAAGLERAVDIGRRLYSVAAPLLDQSRVGRQIQDQAVKGFSAYDKLRDQVQSGYARGAEVLEDARRAVPELGL